MGGTDQTVEVYDGTAWTLLPAQSNMPYVNNGMSAAVMGGNIFVLGGTGWGMPQGWVPEMIATMVFQQSNTNDGSGTWSYGAGFNYEDAVGGLTAINNNSLIAIGANENPTGDFFLKCTGTNCTEFNGNCNATQGSCTVCG